MALNARTEEIIDNLIFKRPSKIIINRKTVSQQEIKDSKNHQPQEEEKEVQEVKEVEEDHGEKVLPLVLDKPAEELTHGEVAQLIEQRGVQVLFDLFPDDPDPNAPVVFEEYVEEPKKVKAKKPKKDTTHKNEGVVQKQAEEVKDNTEKGEEARDEFNKMLAEKINKINENLNYTQDKLIKHSKHILKRNMSLLNAAYFNF